MLSCKASNGSPIPAISLYFYSSNLEGNYLHLAILSKYMKFK